MAENVPRAQHHTATHTRPQPVHRLQKWSLHGIHTTEACHYRHVHAHNATNQRVGHLALGPVGVAKKTKASNAPTGSATARRWDAHKAAWNFLQRRACGKPARQQRYAVIPVSRTSTPPQVQVTVTGWTLNLDHGRICEARQRNISGIAGLPVCSLTGCCICAKFPYLCRRWNRKWKHFRSCART